MVVRVVGDFIVGDLGCVEGVWWGGDINDYVGFFFGKGAFFPSLWGRFQDKYICVCMCMLFVFKFFFSRSRIRFREVD